MRLLNLCLLVVLILLQGPLWLSRHGWFETERLADQVRQAQKKNASLQARNDKLRSEVDDLREGTEAIEARARQELGLVKSDEVFVQLLETPAVATDNSAAR